MQIRRALAALAEKLSHIEDPLTQLKLYVDGKKIRVEVDGRAMEAESGQLLLDFDPVELNRLLEFRVKDNGQAERDKKAEAERWFQRGLELEQSGSAAEEVIAAYKQSLELDPKSAGALVNLGTIYFNAQKWKDAERYYQQALEADPEYSLAHFDLANLYDERGDRKEGSGALHRGTEDFASLCRRALQSGPAVPGSQPADESGASLDRLLEAGSGEPLGQYRPPGAYQEAAGGRCAFTGFPRVTTGPRG